jgi:hypothetical protein
MVYTHSSEEPTPGPRVIAFVAEDDEGATSPIVTSTITVIPVNDIPILDLNGISTAGVNRFDTYVEGSTIALAASSLFIADNDNTTMVSATVTLTNQLDGPEEVLSADTTGTSIAAQYTGNTLQLTGEDTLANYAQVLQSVRYTNNLFNFTRGNPTIATRVFTFTVNDGGQDSPVATSRLAFAAVNDVPFLDLNTANAASQDFAAVFVEEQGAVSVVGNILLFDIDNSNLGYASIRITNPLDGDKESLAYAPFTESVVNGSQLFTRRVDPEADYNNVTGELRVTGLSHIADYERILSSITYNNIADEPNDTPRVIEFEVNDGAASGVVRRTTVSITMVNDSPRCTTGTVAEPHIAEDVTASANVGITVADIVADNTIEDDDAGAQQGIAVVAVDNTNGQWEFQLEGTTTWTQIFQAITTETRAVLLSAAGQTRVRFVPNQHFHGTTTLGFKAWDASDGRVEGTAADATSLSEIDAFSATGRTMTLTVDPVNDAPSMAAAVAVQLLDIDEDETASAGNRIYDVAAATSFVDIDEAPAVPAVDVQNYGIVIVQADTTNGVWEYSQNGGLGWTAVPLVTRTVGLALAMLPAD